MKEHPILFTAEMVKAILEGRKTMTRRIINPQPIDNTEIDGNFFDGKHRGYVKVDGHPNWRQQFAYELCPKKVGDFLWVRESFAYTQFAFDKCLIVGKGEYGISGSEIYKADKDNDDWDGKWKPSIHMPKEAARIWLEIINIRVERLQDISEKDSIAEGISSVYPKGLFGEGYERPDRALSQSAKMCYEHLWQKINGEESWNENPWVWVIEFKRTK